MHQLRRRHGRRQLPERRADAVKLRAVTLLLAAFFFTDARQQCVTPALLYSEARLAFDKADLDRAETLGRQGQRRFGGDPRWNELFASVVADSLGRNNSNAAKAVL